MLAIPTVRVRRSVSGADEEVEEPGALLGWDRLNTRTYVCWGRRIPLNVQWKNS